MKAFEIFLFKVLILLLVLDFSGDFIILYSIYIIQEINPIIRVSISVVLFSLTLLSLLYLKLVFRLSFHFKLVLLLILIPVAYGFLGGVVKNSPSLALRELLPFFTLLLIPIFLNLSNIDLCKIFHFLLKAVLFTVLIKLFCTQVVHYIYYGYFSWRLLLRITPLLLLPLSYIIYSYSNKRDNGLLSFYFIIVIAGILVANARALYIAALSVASLSLSQLRFMILFKLSFLFLLAVFIVYIYSDNDILSIFGYWSGDNFESSYGYRETQFAMLMERFLSYPIFGVGFGFFTPGYESYEDINLSYLLELDLLNFFTKIGIPFSIIYIFAFAFYFLVSISSKMYIDESNILISKSFNAFLIGCLIYSLFQTMHSSILFWILFSFSFSFNAKIINLKFQS